METGGDPQDVFPGYEVSQRYPGVKIHLGAIQR